MNKLLTNICSLERILVLIKIKLQKKKNSFLFEYKSKQQVYMYVRSFGFKNKLNIDSYLMEKELHPSFIQGKKDVFNQDYGMFRKT